MSDDRNVGYEKPAMERYGEFRELTRLTGWCYGPGGYSGLCKDDPGHGDGRS